VRESTEGVRARNPSNFICKVLNLIWQIWGAVRVAADRTGQESVLPGSDLALTTCCRDQISDGFVRGSI